VIGNDIIDLKINLKEDKASKLRYLKKICTDTEIEAICASNNPNLLLWRIWSMKESAYKIVAKKTGVRLFMPKRLETFIENEYLGKVFSEWGIFYTCSLVDEEGGKIVTDASEDRNVVTYSAVESIDSEMYASVEVRKLLQNTICNKLTSLEPAMLELKMQEGIPQVFVGREKMPICVSLSHHGRWISCAFQLTDSKLEN